MYALPYFYIFYVLIIRYTLSLFFHYQATVCLLFQLLEYGTGYSLLIFPCDLVKQLGIF